MFSLCCCNCCRHRNICAYTREHVCSVLNIVYTRTQNREQPPFRASTTRDTIAGGDGGGSGSTAKLYLALCVCARPLGCVRERVCAQCAEILCIVRRASSLPFCGCATYAKVTLLLQPQQCLHMYINTNSHIRRRARANGRSAKELTDNYFSLFAMINGVCTRVPRVCVDAAARAAARLCI